MANCPSALIYHARSGKDHHRAQRSRDLCYAFELTAGAMPCPLGSIDAWIGLLYVIPNKR